MKHKIFGMSGMLISIYAILLTVNSEIIIDNNNDFLMLPLRTILINRYVEKTIDELISNEKLIDAGYKSEKEISYIFVLDVSKSIGSIEMIPNWYEGTIEELNKKIHFPNRSLDLIDKPSMFELFKVKLAQMLIELQDSKEKMNFAIWTIGNKANLIYPQGGNLFKEVTPSNIINAIKSIFELRNDDQSTDFIDLFTKLRSYYKAAIKSVQVKDENPSFSLILLSDFIHDISVKTKEKSYSVKYKEILIKDLSKLEYQIEEFSKDGLFANVIAILGTDRRSNYNANILPYLIDNFQPYQRLRLSISDDNKQLYLRILAKECIKFFYANPSYLEEGASFIVRITEEGEYKIEWDSGYENLTTRIPFESDVKFQILSPVGKQLGNVKYSGRIKDLRNQFLKLRRGDKIRFVYSGRLPDLRAFPVLKIYSKEKKEVYLVPVRFIKKLPIWSVWFMLVVQVLMVLLLLLIIFNIWIRFIHLLKGRFRSQN